MFKTFGEWSLAGYKIKKGSKASWVGNIPMFSESQVTYIGSRYKGMYYAHDSRDPWEEEAYDKSWGGY